MAADFQDVSRIAMQVTQDVVVASIQTDLTERVLARFQKDLLSLIHQVSAHGVVFDLSGVDTLDSFEFRGLRRVMEMANLLGASSILSGLKPGIVFSLIAANADTDGIEATLKTDDAVLTLINRSLAKRSLIDETDVLNEPDEQTTDAGEIEADTGKTEDEIRTNDTARPSQYQ